MKVQSIYTNKLLKKGLEFAANNGSLFAAGTSLVLSSVARPAVILATPHTDKKNKKYAFNGYFEIADVAFGISVQFFPRPNRRVAGCGNS